MLETYLALLKKDDDKRTSLKQAKEDIEAEFGDTAAPLEEERKNIFHWMQENNFPAHSEEGGMIEVVVSKPKYKITDEEKLIRFLAQKNLIGALDFKKSVVNDLRKLDFITEEDGLIDVVTEPELRITVTKKGE